MPIFELCIHEGAPSGALGNAISASALAVFGPTIRVVVTPGRWHRGPMAQVEGLALLDTGAAISGIDERIAKQLGLAPDSAAHMNHPGGAERKPCFGLHVTFPGVPLPGFECRRAAAVNVGRPHILLLGRDLLSRLRLVYNGPMGRVEIAY